MKIKDQILGALRESGDLSVKELVDLLQVSKQAIHIALNQLLDAETVVKFGKTPKTIYRLNPAGNSPEVAKPSSLLARCVFSSA